MEKTKKVIEELNQILDSTETIDEGILDRMSARKDSLKQFSKNLGNKTRGVRKGLMSKGSGNFAQTYDKETSGNLDPKEAKKQSYVSRMTKKLNDKTEKIKSRHQRELSNLQDKLQKEILKDTESLFKGNESDAQELLDRVIKGWDAKY